MIKSKHVSLNVIYIVTCIIAQMLGSVQYGNYYATKYLYNTQPNEPVGTSGRPDISPYLVCCLSGLSVVYQVSRTSDSVLNTPPPLAPSDCLPYTNVLDKRGVHGYSATNYFHAL